MSEIVRDLVKEIVEGGRPSGSGMERAFDAILSGDVDPVLISAFLVSLRMKGESVEDIEAGARVMRSHARRASAPDDIVDTCGTGGLPWVSLNVSTAAAFVVAGAGGRVAKHGNRSVPPKTGSADVLEALGVNLNTSEAQFERCIDQARVAFMFAQAHHSAMRHVAPIRKQLGLRTIFNLLGPLSNPAGAKRQVVGVFNGEWIDRFAEVLRRLGAQRAWVVHGADGMDEITVCDETFVADVTPGGIRRFKVAPEDVGLKRAQPESLRGGTASENASAIRSIFAGSRGAFRDVVAMNAGAALFVSGVAGDFEEGVRKAEEAMDSGAAQSALQRLVALSNEADT